MMSHGTGSAPGFTVPAASTTSLGTNEQPSVVYQAALGFFKEQEKPFLALEVNQFMP